MSYGTYTTTYTVVDIRKAFESFEADLRMIARRTEKWTGDFVDKVFYDVVKLAEAKYLSKASIILQDATGKPIRAAQYTVNENGTGISGERAGGNDWTNIPNTNLEVILQYTAAWHALTEQQQQAFGAANGFKINWTPSNIDTSFSHLTKQSAQTYSSNGYEISKANFK